MHGRRGYNQVAVARRCITLLPRARTPRKARRNAALNLTIQLPSMRPPKSQVAERSTVPDVLQRCGGNVAKAAAEMGRSENFVRLWARRAASGESFNNRAGQGRPRLLSNKAAAAAKQMASKKKSARLHYYRASAEGAWPHGRGCRSKYNSTCFEGWAVGATRVQEHG